ncbi:GNAT family N-acetyltransferase [Lihuaxuella thermophila]|uniref:Predicted N-acetyltransferase YhbS n=1 Tax=Lihuaxuella thermophila TaxID=1173111 RepID=A0A1H8FDD9_9BACL|nr:GNAT family N-acetyltransferase [Lihuaxuella thermophila]SEN29514.1 Predicted N-acetyltransferase YhbS [Lihuaxuella thermophila]
MNYSLRTATPDDFEFVFQLNKTNMRPYVEQLRGWDDEAEREDMKTKFRPFHDQIVVIGNQDAGIFAVDESDSEICLRHIEILPAYQNRGVGTALIQQILSRAEQRRLPVKLTVLKMNPARHLYQRLGFRLDGETDLKYRMIYLPGFQL